MEKGAPRVGTNCAGLRVCVLGSFFARFEGIGFNVIYCIAYAIIVSALHGLDNRRRRYGRDAVSGKADVPDARASGTFFSYYLALRGCLSRRGRIFQAWRVSLGRPRPLSPRAPAAPL